MFKLLVLMAIIVNVTYVHSNDSCDDDTISESELSDGHDVPPNDNLDTYVAPNTHTHDNHKSLDDPLTPNQLSLQKRNIYNLLCNGRIINLYNAVADYLNDHGHPTDSRNPTVIYDTLKSKELNSKDDFVFPKKNNGIEYTKISLTNKITAIKSILCNQKEQNLFVQHLTELQHQKNSVKTAKNKKSTRNKRKLSGQKAQTRRIEFIEDGVKHTISPTKFPPMALLLQASESVHPISQNTLIPRHKRKANNCTKMKSKRRKISPSLDGSHSKFTIARQNINRKNQEILKCKENINCGFNINKENLKNNIIVLISTPTGWQLSKNRDAMKVSNLLVDKERKRIPLEAFRKTKNNSSN